MRKGIFIKKWILMVFVLPLFVSCGDVEIDQTVEEILSAQPTIESFEPASSPVRGRVTVKGTFLNFVSKAYIGDQECDIYRKINSGELIIEVAPSAQSGEIKLVTKAEKEVMSSGQLTVTYPTPSITSEVPAEKLVNETIILEGENLEVVTKVMFGANEGAIEFQEPTALVVKVPYSKDANNDISIQYYTGAAPTNNLVKAGFAILIPQPEVAVWPSLLRPNQDVTISGNNMNLVQTVMFGEIAIEEFVATAESLSFALPEGLSTATYEIALGYDEGAGTVTSPIVPLIAVNNVAFFDYNIHDINSVEVNKDAYAISSQLNGDVASPPFPGAAAGNYIQMKMAKESSSTVYKQRFSKSDNWDLYSSIPNQVLHFWINTNNTAPDIQVEIIKNEKATLKSYNTGNDWVLVAVRLNDVFPGIVADSYCRFNYRNPSDSDTEINMNWVILADEVLDGIGAVDLTDQFQ